MDNVTAGLKKLDNMSQENSNKVSFFLVEKVYVVYLITFVHFQYI